MARRTRSNELTRVRNMMKRLEKHGYVRTGADIESLTTRQLANIKSGKQLVGRFYKFGEEAYEELRRQQNIKKLKETVKRYGREYGITEISISSFTEEEISNISKLRGREKFEAILRGSTHAGRDILSSRDDVRSNKIGYNEQGKKLYDSSGRNIGRIYYGSEATAQINKLLSIAEYGKHYMGTRLKDYGSGDTAIDLIHSSGEHLVRVITKARSKFTDEELVERIKRDYGSVEFFATIVERMVLAVYDKEYAEWAGGNNAYHADMMEIENTLGVTF